MTTSTTRGAAFERNAQAYAVLLDQLRERMRWALAGGGERLRERHLARGKIPVRDRIDLLLDPGSPFLELSALACWGLYGNEVPAAGIVTGIGRVSGVHCMVIANDATVKGGSFFAETVRKHVRAQEIAWENRLPCLYLVDCGGAFLPEQDRVFPDFGHFGTSFYHQCRMSADGLPQLSAVFGGCTAGGAYIPALSDESVMVDGTGRIHLGGPPIVKAAIAEVVDGETLGGAAMHARVSGVTDYLAMSETEALARLREIVAHLNWPVAASATRRPVRPPALDPAELTGIVGTDLKQPYDVREVILRLVDGSEMQEFKPEYGGTLVCATAHLHGYPVGILANNGVLFSDSANKAAQFIQLCNHSRTPLVYFQNITGFMVGEKAETGGIIKDGAKMINAVANSSVPQFTILVGGAYGAGYYAMCGRPYDPRLILAWPTSRTAVMGGEQAAGVLSIVQEEAARRRGQEPDQDQIALLKLMTKQKFDEESDPYYATARLWDDGLIDPRDTRMALTVGLSISYNRDWVSAGAPRYGVFRM